MSLKKFGCKLPTESIPYLFDYQFSIDSKTDANLRRKLASVLLSMLKNVIPLP